MSFVCDDCDDDCDDYYDDDCDDTLNYPQTNIDVSHDNLITVVIINLQCGGGNELRLVRCQDHLGQVC